MRPERHCRRRARRRARRPGRRARSILRGYDKAELALSPISKAYRAIKDQDYGKLDEFTDAAAIRNRELDQRTADELVRRFDRAALSPRTS